MAGHSSSGGPRGPVIIAQWLRWCCRHGRLLCTTVCLSFWFLSANAATNSLQPGNNSRALLYNTQRNIHANISELLDNLLRGYDNSVRPDFGGNCTLTRGLSVPEINSIPGVEINRGDWFIRGAFITGPPAVVEVDIMVRSMGPISEVDMVIMRLRLGGGLISSKLGAVGIIAISSWGFELWAPEASLIAP